MSRVLAATVILAGEDGPIVLPAGSVPSEQQAAEITNPKAWADEAEVVEVPEPEPVVEPEPEPKPDAESHEDEDVDANGKPKRFGRK